MSTPPTGIAGLPDYISFTTITSLSAVLAIFLSAYTANRLLLPSTTSSLFRGFFIWHFFDALVHFTLEGSFLFNCFFTSLPLSKIVQDPKLWAVSFTPPGTHFLGRADVLQGAFYGTGPTAKLWQEYAKADRRWGGTDLGVISLELLTVGLMAPLAVLVCYLIRKGDEGRAWFVMVFIATGELYGGFMTFAPEWLSANHNLDGSNFMYFWVYLMFMNLLWVFIPGYILYKAYDRMVEVFARNKAVVEGKKMR